MDALNLLPLFLLVLVRLASFFFTAPVFSYRGIPARFKIGLSACFAWIVTLSMHDHAVPLTGAFPLIVMKEALIGLSIGFAAGLLFYAIQIAGGFIDLQTGFAIANLIDPNNGMQTPITGQFLYVLMIVFFFAADAHHMFLNGIYYSFQWVPVEGKATALFSGAGAHDISQLFLQMFAIAFQMALPIVGSLFLVDVAVGIVARTVPQLNVFVVGLPLKIAASLLILFFAMPLYVAFFRDLFDWAASGMRDFMALLGSPK